MNDSNVFKLSGIGYSFVSLNAFMVSTDYFKKRKALALGLIASGGGIGSVVVPNLIRVLFERLGFSGALVVYSEYSDCIFM